MGNILKIYHLKNEALLDLYKRLDKDLRPMPKKPDGSFVSRTPFINLDVKSDDIQIIEIKK
jgi:hypothetical protein